MAEKKKRAIVPPDRDGHYDIDGVSFDTKLGVVVGSDATPSNVDLTSLNVVKSPLWHRWLQKWMACRAKLFSAKSGPAPTG